jgi:alpha-L-fucosidase
MDIGIAPDRRGLIDEPDSSVLAEFGRRIHVIFSTNLAKGAQATASNIRGHDDTYAAANALEGASKFNHYWAADDGVKDADLTLSFGEARGFSVISLREPVQLGQRIDGWSLEYWRDGRWQEFARGVGIGARRLWRGPLITAEKIRLRITNASASPAISEFGVYLEPESSRKEALAIIENGLDKTAWKIVSATSEGAPAKAAIDGNPDSFWHTHTAAGRQPPPQSLVVDMGSIHELTGLLYLPRQDNCAVGNVTRYAFAVSLDTQAWTEIAQGEFGNIAANPVQQKVTFGHPAKARYFKFTATAGIDGCVNAAEIGAVGK